MKAPLFFLTFLGLVFSGLSFASPLALTDLEGNTVSFASLKGKWVLINYWASWCQPCLEEIAELNRFYEKKKDKVVLFAVNYDSPSRASQLALVKKYGIHYPSLQTDPARILGLGDIRGVPATFVFDPKGNLRDTLYGGQTQASLNAALGNA